MKKIIDVYYDENGHQIIEDAKTKRSSKLFITLVELSYWVLNFFLRTIMFLVFFTFLVTISMAIEIKIFGDTIDSPIMLFLLFILALIASTYIFNRFFVEEVNE